MYIHNHIIYTYIYTNYYTPTCAQVGGAPYNSIRIRSSASSIQYRHGVVDAYLLLGRGGVGEVLARHLDGLAGAGKL